MYWLAKQLEGGEDPRFIARRLVILASEDVGLADPRGLPLAVAAFHAVEQVGLPECALNLAHVTLFLATAPKSNSATRALGAAREALKDAPVQAVPLWLRDSHTVTNRKLGQGAGYLYSHEFPEGISGQEYLENPLELYQPGAAPAGAEAAIVERLERWRKLKEERKRAEEKGNA
jgi:putative ATPase